MDQKEWIIIINPNAGYGRGLGRWQGLKNGLIQIKWSFREVFTEYPGHATTLTKKYIQKGYKKILCVGGDGTNNEVLNGLMQAQTSDPVDYALYPSGSGNDFARHFKIPRDPCKWVDQMGFKVSTLALDVGSVRFNKNGISEVRYFLNVAGLAFDAQVVESLTSSKKIVRSRFIYLKHVVTGLLSFRPKSVMVESIEKSYRGQIYTLNVGNCRYSGGGMQIVPHARANDGLLAITLVTNIPKWKILLNLGKLFSGKIGTLKEVMQWQTSSLTVEPYAQEKVLLEVDGEFLGMAPCVFNIEKNKINLLIPPSHIE